MKSTFQTFTYENLIHTCEKMEERKESVQSATIKNLRHLLAKKESAIRKKHKPHQINPNKNL